MAKQDEWWAGDVAAAGGPTPESRKTEATIGSSEASARSSGVSAATGEARLPYVAPREQAELQATLLRNIQLQQDLLRSTKGERLGKDERSDLETLVSGFENVTTLLRRFRDDYTGAGLGFPTQIESAIQKRASGFGTPGQASWWQSANVLDMIERNRFFGASLTEGEKAAWQATTITPAMDPASIRENLRRRQEIVEKALGRSVATLRAGGYRPAQIEAALGGVAPMFTPKKIVDRQKFFASEAGTPAEGGGGEAPPPEGAQVGGEPIKGFRFSAGSEADIVKYTRSPEFTPEGYGELVARKALEEGQIQPEQAADYAARTAAAAAERYSGLTPEERSRVPGAIDYSAIDEAAQENAGLGAIAMQALTNAPESAVQLAQGLTALPVDAVRSVLEGQRTGSIKTLTDLAGELVAQAGGDPQGPTTQAVVAAMKERYEDPLLTFSTDPLGMLGDLSVVLTAGGTAGARLPGAVGSAAQKVATAGRVIDPLSAVAAVPEAYRAVGAAAPKAMDTITNAPGAATKFALGLTTGVPGGEGYGRAFQVGRERGQAGAPTAREQSFVEQMRGGAPDEVIAQAESAVRNMQEQASQAYKSGMVDVSGDATVLDFGGIDKTLDNLRDRAFYKGQVRDARSAAVYEKIKGVVDEWKTLDPAQYHTPEGMDALKQRIGDVADDMAVANDRKASSIATGVYRSVRQEIAKQVPSYDRTMKDYEKAADTLRDIRRTFSLNPTASVDTQLRKLQSVMRNNANTNYGYRQELADLMERQGGANLMDSLSAQSISSFQPRGLASIPATGLGLSGIGGVATATMQNAPGFFDPTSLALLPLTSPRAVGEASYYAGRGVGAAERAGAAMADIARPVTDRLADLYQRYPAATLATAQLGSRTQDVENQFLADAAQRYAQTPTPVAEAPVAEQPVWQSPETPSLPEGSSVVNVDGVDIALPPGTTYDPETREIVGPGGVRIPLSALAGGQQ
ncbi:MAG: hypothetical protein RLZZ387_2573 [Chloroflexota bacterium]|jgi:hypothetical protein